MAREVVTLEDIAWTIAERWFAGGRRQGSATPDEWQALTRLGLTVGWAESSRLKAARKLRKPTDDRHLWREGKPTKPGAWWISGPSGSMQLIACRRSGQVTRWLALDAPVCAADWAPDVDRRLWHRPWVEDFPPILHPLDPAPKPRTLRECLALVDAKVST